MEQKQKMVSLLQQQQKLFCSFYKITQDMLVCEPENMETDMEKRLQLKEKIDRLEEEKQELFRQDDKLRVAARCAEGCGALPESYAQVLQAGREFQGLLYQIRELEPQVLKRAFKERNTLEKKIREVNQSPAAQAPRFMVGTDRSSQRSGKIGKA